MLRKSLIATGILLAGLALGAVKCSEDNDSKQSQQAQQQVTQNAFSAVPPYIPSKFSGREDINWSIQETEGRHTWYVYALAMDGRPIFYIVSDMRPRNKCVSITAPDRVQYRHGHANVRKAPSMLGTYGGGACDTYYVREAATKAYIQLSGRTFTLLASKAPLPIETDRLRPVDEKKTVDE